MTYMYMYVSKMWRGRRGIKGGREREIEREGGGEREREREREEEGEREGGGVCLHILFPSVYTCTYTCRWLLCHWLESSWIW